MRALHSLPLIAALALLLGGCVSPVVIDHRAGTDFSQYRSYAIEAPDADQEALSLNGQRVQEAVHRELADGPLTRADLDQADLAVRYAFVPVEKFQGSTLVVEGDQFEADGRMVAQDIQSLLHQYSLFRSHPSHEIGDKGVLKPNPIECFSIGFGGFQVRERPERMGRNPKTGEPMPIAVSRSPTFKAGKAFKDAIN